MVRQVDRFISSVGAVGGAGGGSQIPGFVDQYRQRLGGHLDEARMVADKFRNNPETTLSAVEQAELAERVRELEAAHVALETADPVDMPLAFLRHIDWEIANRTWEAFTPNVPLDTAGLLYGGIGLILALILYTVLKGISLALFGRRSSREAY